MSLIVEDGSQVANANTYVSDLEYTTYAAARGLTVGIDAATREIELIKAMDFIESHRDVFKGIKTNYNQALQYPRSDVYIDGYSTGSDTIPDALKNAQIEAAASTIDLLKTGDSQNIQKEKVGDIEVSYFSGGSFETARSERVNIHLDILINSNKMVIRV